MILQKDAATLRFGKLLLFLHCGTCQICKWRMIRNYIQTSKYVRSILKPSVLSCPSQVYALRDTLLAAVKAAWDGQQWSIRSTEAAVLYQDLTTPRRRLGIPTKKLMQQPQILKIWVSSEKVTQKHVKIGDSVPKLSCSFFLANTEESDMRAMLLNSWTNAEVGRDWLHLAQDSWYVGWQFLLNLGLTSTSCIQFLGSNEK